MRLGARPAILVRVIGLLVVSHGTLAQAMLDTASEIVGPFAAGEAVAVSRHESLEAIESAMDAAVRRVDLGDGVLVLADVFGGTASNVAMGLVARHRVQVVAGCNLPMLLKLGSARAAATDLAALAEELRAYGQRSVLVASALLEGAARRA
jgi:PTS system mannose-specific IIA component